MRFTIRENGYLAGTFEGADEAAAFDAYAASEGYNDFKDLLSQRGLKRDNFTVEEVN